MLELQQFRVPDMAAQALAGVLPSAPSCRHAEETLPCCRQLRPDDSRIVMELQQAGALAKSKRRRVEEEEELQPLPSPPRMVRASSSMLRVKGGVANLGELLSV